MEVLCRGCGLPIGEDDGVWRVIGHDVVFCCAACDELHKRVSRVAHAA